MKKNQFDFEEFVEELSDMTDKNYHTEALILVSEYYGLKKYVKILEKILEIQDIEGYLPGDLSQYKYSLYQEIMKYIPEEDFEAVQSAL